jgi:DedD protein
MDKALKQRLVGASVLIALAVVVLPMLLGDRPESPQDSRPIELPPKPRELSFETRRFPIGEQDPEKPSVLPPPPATLPVAEPDPAPPAGTEDLSSPPAKMPAVDLESESPPAPSLEAGTEPGAADPQDSQPAAGIPAATPEPDAASSPGGRYLVQVASFSSVANAQRLSSRLTAEGMPVRQDTVDSAAGTLHRVRVGPFEERGSAEDVIRRLESSMPDLNPRLLDLRPDDEAPVTSPSDPMVRWVVQVGSFSEAGNAEQLVFRLRDAGFAASSRAISNDGALSYKVRVGPVLERDEAVALAASIRSRLGIDGLVMSAD